MFRVLVAVRFTALAMLFALAVSPVPAGAEEAVPLDPVEPLSEESGRIGPPAVILRPDGGMIAVWRDASAGEVVGRWFSPADQAVGSTTGRFVLASVRGNSLDVAIARRSGGSGDRYLAVWAGAWPDFALSAKPFDGSGSPLGAVRAVAPTSVLAPALAALPGGGYVVAFWEASGETSTLRYRLLSDNGSPLGSVVVDQLPTGSTPSAVDVTVDPEGAFTLSWSWLELTRSVIVTRSFSSFGAPLAPPFVVASVNRPAVIYQHAVAAVGAGELLAVWKEERPGGETSLWARHFHPDGSLAPPRRVDVPRDEAGHVEPSLAATTDGRAVVAWSEEDATGTRLLARLLDADAGSRSEPFLVAALPGEFDFVNGTDIDIDGAGRLAFGWGVGLYSDFSPPTGLEGFQASYARRFQEVADAVPPVPDAPPLVSDALPGFRTWVVVTAGGVAVPGSKEDACLPETLCVSGRLPGRSEVFVRVVGPRPNGRLWPTLVKLTTSRVEVWIEQVSTGEVEYYVLDEARPGFDELPGLFDREGFPSETDGS